MCASRVAISHAGDRPVPHESVVRQRAEVSSPRSMQPPSSLLFYSQGRQSHPHGRRERRGVDGEHTTTDTTSVHVGPVPNKIFNNACCSATDSKVERRVAATRRPTDPHIGTLGKEKLHDDDRWPKTCWATTNRTRTSEPNPPDPREPMVKEYLDPPDVTFAPITTKPSTRS